MTRRQSTRPRFLVSCSAIAGIGLAGCTGGDEPTEDGAILRSSMVR